MKLDKQTVLDLIDRKVEKILIYFYDAGCSGMKIDIKESFDITSDLEKLNLSSSPFAVYVEKKDVSKFQGATIVRTVIADHTGKEKVRYIFSSAQVKERCGCGSSFGFEKKAPKLNLNKLQDFKNNFKK